LDIKYKWEAAVWQECSTPKFAKVEIQSYGLLSLWKTSFSTNSNCYLSLLWPQIFTAPRFQCRCSCL